jgi:sigma-B regulation protein RsbU (phosphoserine phosphatase)
MSKSETESIGHAGNTAEYQNKIFRLENKIKHLTSAVNELNVLNDLAIAASSSLEVDEVLDIVVAKSIKAVQAAQGSIMLLTAQEENPFKTLVRQQDQAQSMIMNYRIGLHISGWVLKNLKPLLIENLAADSRFHPTPQEIEEIKTLLCIPIFFKGELLGILTVINKKTREPFNESDLRLLSIIAAQSGQLIRNRQLQEEALENKRIEQELALAREIQMGLIPKEMPRTENLQIASYIQTANDVGGDYFDYFKIDEDRIGIVIADVSGHGPSAALIMTMVKGILHSIVQKFESADQVLRDLNAVLYNITPPEMFVTMMFLVFQAKNRTLRYSNAGHPSLLYYNAISGACKPLTFYSAALCLSPLVKYQEREISLSPGDVIFVYTDGVIEAFDASGNMLTEAGLLQGIQAAAAETPPVIIKRIQKTIQEFTGQTPQGDDIAMIAVRVT